MARTQRLAALIDNPAKGIKLQDAGRWDFGIWVRVQYLDAEGDEQTAKIEIEGYELGDVARKANGHIKRLILDSKDFDDTEETPVAEKGP